MSTNLENIIKRYIDRNARIFYSNQIRAKLYAASLAARHCTIAWKLTNPNQLQAALKLSESIALTTGSKAVMSYRDHSFIIYQFQLHSQFWQSYTRQDVKNLGVGLADRRRQVDIEFLESAPQIGIFGSPGSGKTELIKSAIVALASTYTPHELKFIISDWHNVLRDFDNLAHLAMPIAHNDDADTDRLIAFARQEQARRLNNGSDNGYRLAFIIDEAAEIVTNDERIQAITQIANSRKWSLNLILGTQKPTAKDLPVDKILNRFCGLVSDARVSHLVTGQAGLEAHKLTGAGDFLHIVGSHHQRFQVAMATEADIARLPRAEVIMPDVDMSPVRMPELPPSPGRPKNEVEPGLVADYLANYEQSVRQFIQEREISQRKYYLHKDFAEELKIELAKYGLGICRLEDYNGTNNNFLS